MFLKAVDSGLIASDSTLLVEHLDRVTREKPTQAHELFIGIVNRGLTLVTLNDGQICNEATINGDLSKLFIAVIKLAGANEENEKRSMRIREAFARNAVASAVTIAEMIMTIATTATIVMVVTTMVTDGVTEKLTGSGPSPGPPV